MRHRRDRAAVGPSEATAIAADELPAMFAGCGGRGALLLAVSGGADSVALMHLARDWAQSVSSGAQRPQLSVATVDHGLRTESLTEAIGVGEQARKLGLEHAILPWTGTKPATGLQVAARVARYRLLTQEAHRIGAGAILTAHTRDDQAETLLMRLARGSSVDGLAGMRSVSAVDGVTCLRPLLDIPRARLVATLLVRGIDWIDDPSNEDTRFERVRLRQASAARAALGLTDAHLALTARRLGRVRCALDRFCAEFVAAHAQLNEGAYCRIDADAFRGIPDEIALRVLARVLSAFGGQHEIPPLARIERLAQALGKTRGVATLGGCRFAIDARFLVASREPGRRGLEERIIGPGTSVEWDRRFVITMAEAQGGHGPLAVCRIRALGADGLRQLRAERGRPGQVPTGTSVASPFAGWPPQAITTLPSIWRGDALCAVPHCTQTNAARQLLPLQSAFHAAFRGVNSFAERSDNVTLG